jgi:hypothetical protein
MVVTSVCISHLLTATESNKVFSETLIDINATGGHQMFKVWYSRRRYYGYSESEPLS